MAKYRGAVIVDTERCKGCDLCVVACPTDVLSMSKEANTKGYNFSHMANFEACTGCSTCANVCPDACITVYRVKT
jgi:2-oxoglutarate ferredoxin oxidoreductase subunit delta